MAKYILRFYGRFVFADASATAGDGAVHVLALDPTTTLGAGGAPHRLLLAAPRRAIAIEANPLVPSFVMMQPAGPPDLAEIAVWEIARLQVTPRLNGPFRWARDPVLSATGQPVLADLAPLAPNAVLDRAALRVGTGPRVSSVISVKGGTGTLGVIDPARVHFEKFQDADTATDGAQVSIAEFVEVEVDTPATDQRLFIDLAGSGSPAFLAFVSLAGAPPVITITNLCNEGHSKVDREFAACYDVLQTPPPLAERLVPVTVGALGRVFNCFKGGYIKG